jgi:hypothetical protein
MSAKEDAIRDAVAAYEGARQKHMMFQAANIANLTGDALVALRQDAAVAEYEMIVAYRDMRKAQEPTP